MGRGEANGHFTPALILGLKIADTEEPVTENTVYYIASTGKHFTTTLTGQLLKNAGAKHVRFDQSSK